MRLQIKRGKVNRSAKLREHSFVILLFSILLIIPVIMGSGAAPDLRVSEHNFEADFSSLNTQIIDYYQVLYPDGSGEAHQILRLNTSDEDVNHSFGLAVSYKDAVFGGSEVLSAYEWKDNMTNTSIGPFKGISIEKISEPISKPELAEQVLDGNWRDRLNAKLDSKVIPPEDYDIKSYGLMLIPNSTVDIHLWVKHTPQQKDKMYVSILGSEGGTSLLWDNSTFTVRNVYGNIWWRDIDFSDTISSGTKLIFPHSVTDDCSQSSNSDATAIVKPAEVRYSNGTFIGHSIEWPTSTTTMGAYDTQAYNSTDTSWTLDRDYLQGDEVRIAFGKIVNFSYKADNNPICVDGLRFVPAEVSLNLSGWNASAGSNGLGEVDGGCQSTQCDTDNCDAGGSGCSSCRWECKSQHSSQSVTDTENLVSHEPPSGGVCSKTEGTGAASSGACVIGSKSDSGGSISYSFVGGEVWQASCSSSTEYFNSNSGNTCCSVSWYCYWNSYPAVSSMGSYTVYFYPNRTALKVNGNVDYDSGYDWRYDSTESGTKFNVTGNDTQDLSSQFSTGNNYLTFDSASSEGTGLLYAFFEHQNETNDPPVWADIADWAIDEDTNPTLDLGSNISDSHEGDTTLEISWEENDTSAVRVDSINNVTNIIQFSTVANQSGSSNITLYLVDSGGLISPESFILTVNPVDDVPNFDTSTVDDSNVTSPTNSGENVTFTTSISDPDDDEQVALLICDEWGINGISCAGLQYCRDPESGFKAEGSVSCSNKTDWTKKGAYPWMSFALDDGNNVRAGAIGTFNVNLTGDYPLNPEMYVNDVKVWNYSEFLGDTETVTGFADEINDYLASCTPVDGYCDVPIVLHSDSIGVLNVNNINIHMNVTEYTWDTSNLPEGTQYKVRVTSTDGELNSTWDESDADFTISHQQITYGNKTFYVRDSSDSAMASFDDNGNLILAGTCSISTCDDISSALFAVKNSADNAVAYIDTSGGLCLETGDCSDFSASCNAPDNSFVIRNSNDEGVAYIDSTGDLCLKGGLVENGSP